MRNDDKALKRLNYYIGTGKNYYDATELLKHEGYTQLEIDNASFALRSGNKTTDFNPILADSLNKANNIMAKDKERNDSREIIDIIPFSWTNMVHIVRGGEAGSWWYFVPFLLITAGFLYFYLK